MKRMVGSGFIKTVGKLPFSGRNIVRGCYMDGSRAARYGNAPLKHLCESIISGYARTNTQLAVLSVSKAAIAGVEAVTFDELQFLPGMAGRRRLQRDLPLQPWLKKVYYIDFKDSLLDFRRYWLRAI